MTTELDTIQAQALPENLVVVKMELEQMMAAARTAPREPAKIMRTLDELLKAYPAAAEGAVYVKPVGTVTEVTCSNGKCKLRYQVSSLNKDTRCTACDTPAIANGHVTQRKVTKFAEGLSIRAAETIRSVYGYTSLAITQSAPDADGKVRITGCLVDYAAGNRTSDERTITPWYKARGGGMTKTPEDRFLDVVVKAHKAKLRRDLILDNTDAIVKAMFRDQCERITEGMVSKEQMEQKVIPAFGQYGITPEELDLIMARPRALGWDKATKMQARKILAALQNEETTKVDLMAGLVIDVPSSEPQAKGSLSGLAGTVTEEPPVEQKQADDPEKSDVPPSAAQILAEMEHGAVRVPGLAQDLQISPLEISAGLTYLVDAGQAVEHEDGTFTMTRNETGLTSDKIVEATVAGFSECANQSQLDKLRKDAYATGLSQEERRTIREAHKEHSERIKAKKGGLPPSGEES